MPPEPQRIILPGMIFNTAFPMFEGDPKPLSVYKDCPEHSNCAHRCQGQTYCGRVHELHHLEDARGEVVRIVTDYKIRYAMVLTTSNLSINARWLNVVVAPIVGIHDDEIDAPRNKMIINRDIRMFAYYYLGKEITGMHCSVDLGSLCYIPKQWLGDMKANLNGDADVREAISVRLGIFLAQRKLRECDGCKRPCENCVIRIELEQIKEKIKPTGA